VSAAAEKPRAWASSSVKGCSAVILSVWPSAKLSLDFQDSWTGHFSMQSLGRVLDTICTMILVYYAGLTPATCQPGREFQDSRPRQAQA